MQIKHLLCAALLATATATLPEGARAADPATYFGKHESVGDDRTAIETLLATYTNAVMTGDQKAFEAILLNDQVPFSSTSGVTEGQGALKTVDTRHYDQFRQGIFESGQHFDQHFYNVHILQDGPLAEVSLDFVTREIPSGSGGWGWKIIQLLKVEGQWKIASEFYTGHELPKDVTF